jgi:hypothetical protein
MEHEQDTVFGLMIKKKRYTVLDLVTATMITQCFTACFVLLLVRECIREAMRDGKSLVSAFDAIDATFRVYLLVSIATAVSLRMFYMYVKRFLPSSDDTATEPEGRGHED